MVIHPTRKSTKRLRDVLDQLFGYLDQSSKSRQEEVRKKRIFLLSLRPISTNRREVRIKKWTN
jgi:hypothetical protein